VVGVVSSAILLGEEVTTALAIGLVLIIIGVALNLLSDRGVADQPPTDSEADLQPFKEAL